MSIRNVGKQLGRWATICGLVLTGFCLSGCRTHSPEQQSTEGPPGLSSSPDRGAEVLRVGDSLTVTFTDTPILIPPFEEKIKEDGTIKLTLSKIFTAVGKSRGDLEKEIRDFYVPRYYKYMTVSVKQVESTRWYYVDGEVKLPNRQIYNSPITVSKAIASAGGFTDFANKKKVRLTRVDGRTQIVNCPKALTKPSLDPEVYAGDKIYVPRRVW